MPRADQATNDSSVSPGNVLLNLGAIVDALGGVLVGEPQQQVHALAPLETATSRDLSFLSNPKFEKLLASSAAGCVIVSSDFQAAAAARGACIVTSNPHHYFARLTQFWKQYHGLSKVAGIHPSAVIDPSAVIHPTASVGPLCVIESGVRIGASTVLESRVTIARDCVVGERCIIHPGAVIGADGFGFAPFEGTWEKVEQLGAVQIGNDVEIGANTCIDRGALQNTVIEDGVKLDNLIQIGHNVRIGRHTAMAGFAGVAGSATIGAHCTIGGAASILGHLTIADHVNISAVSVVTRSISKPGHYTGIFPIDDNAAWEKNAVTLKQLHSLRERIRSLENAAKKA